jgi:ketosteroid isomerase-like protein
MKQLFERGDHVVSFVRLRGRARTTGGRIDAPFAYVFTFKGEAVSRFHVYSNRGEALAAAGLVDPAEIEAARVRI